MNNSPINSTINSTTVGEQADKTSLRCKNIETKIKKAIIKATKKLVMINYI